MNGFQKATLAGGCFWCLEAVFDELKGVVSVESGYSGGHVENPSYRAVCTGMTGHAEVVQVTFDPAVVTYEQLLEVFWAMHDPTQIDRQGPDVGDQYRSVIFTHSPDQALAATESKARAQAAFPRPIATEIEPLTAFYPAEDYHQRYYDLNGHTPYCHVFPADVVAKLGLATSA